MAAEKRQVGWLQQCGRLSVFSEGSPPPVCTQTALIESRTRGMIVERGFILADNLEAAGLLLSCLSKAWA